MSSENIYTCSHCNKSFKSSQSLNAHTRIHSINYTPSDTFKILAIKIRTNNEEAYKLNPSKCTHCSSILPYDKRKNKFCNSSCAASHNNYGKIRSQETRDKLSLAICETHKNGRRRINEINDWCRLYKCTCKNCDKKWLNRTKRKYCDDCSHLYCSNGRDKYAFNFNVYKFPDLFDLKMLAEIGFYSKTNPNGLTRDHKISVYESVINNYDPFYIRHPLNCELMRYEDNNRKRTNSSILYDDLVHMVNLYEENKKLEG